MTDSLSASLFDGESLSFEVIDQDLGMLSPDSVINEKYVRGEIRIVTEQARYPLNTIAQMVESESYQLSPEYQRRHRWSPESQSKLIESLIMNVPIPPVFLYEYNYSRYEVMDGLQRLTAIHDFYKDKFALVGLTQWPELNGRTYSGLPDKISEGIDRRYLFFVRSMPSGRSSPSISRCRFEGSILESFRKRHRTAGSCSLEKCREVSS